MLSLTTKRGNIISIDKLCIEQSKILKSYTIEPESFASGTFGDIYSLINNDTKISDKILKITTIYYSSVEEMKKYFENMTKKPIEKQNMEQFTIAYNSEYMKSKKKFTDEVKTLELIKNLDISPTLYDAFVCKNICITTSTGNNILQDIGFIIVDRYSTSFDNIIYTIEQYSFSENVIKNFIDNVWKSYHIFNRLNVDGIQPNNILVKINNNIITKMVIGDWGDFADENEIYPITFEYVKNRILNDLGIIDQYNQTTKIDKDFHGGVKNMYKEKYLKYKSKYLQLKNKI
jgi:hypothetical protein